MAELAGSETEKNLMVSFANESQGRNRYTYFSKIAKKEGYEQISAIFSETADNELEHARLFFTPLGEAARTMTITGTFPLGISNTEKNLTNAIMGEHEENTHLYPGFADIAEKEGFKDIAFLFHKIAEVEVHHEARYRKLHQNLIENEVFKKPQSVKWKCRKCGFIVEGNEATPKCACCQYPQAYFELLCDNF